MAEDRRLELPEHVVDKIQKVLGISPTSLPKHDLVSLIEDLCDTALMFEREELKKVVPRLHPHPFIFPVDHGGHLEGFHEVGTFVHRDIDPRGHGGQSHAID